MKATRSLIQLAAALACGLAANAMAQEPGRLVPLPDKLPPSVEARVGKVDFKRGLPTPKGIEQLFEIQDFQRATQLYQWAIPAIGVMGWHKASIANGKTGETDWVIYDAYGPRQGILTPNSIVSYVMAFPDLKKTGPLVIDYAAGRVAGIVMDYWQRPHADFGLTGPEKGATGGKILVLGPGQEAPDEVAGFHVVQMPTRFAFVGYRVLDRSETDKLAPLTKMYPYSQRANPPAAKLIPATKDYTQSHPRGFAYWESVNELIQREAVEERDRFFLAMLRDLGIEKGKPFSPDAKQKKLLEDAALLGEEMAKLIVYEKRFIGNYYRPGARWQYALVVDPDQRVDNYDQLDERTDWFYEAISSSYAMITTTPGVGSVYLSTYRDKDGDWLDGGKSYRLRIAPNPPMKQFWAVSVYDIDTRNLFRNESLKAEVSSNSKGLQKNGDGSVDVYFGPKAPSGKESNWVQTVPDKFWFPYFRLYAPTEAYFDKSWPLPDIEKVK
ncbi:MAG: DUF1254 domain-containing protein [Planctomycetota bacterium]|nr:DUF1254 domain-containing protein [Planctomycetota bacterium]